VCCRWLKMGAGIGGAHPSRPGLANQEICGRLWLSMATVKTHVSHLLAKTGARDRVQLVLLALRTGVVGLDELLTGPYPRDRHK